MTVPSTFKTTYEYMSEVLQFLKSYQWLYNYNNTHIIAKNIFSNFPLSWRDFFKTLSNDQLNSFCTGVLQDGCPDDLKAFSKNVKVLTPMYTAENVKMCDYKFPHNCGINPKKLHEILSLAPLVSKICQDVRTNFVIDVGCGVGHVSQLLSNKFNLMVLGVECSSEFVKLALKNQENVYPETKDSVKFAEHYIKVDSALEIEKLIKDNFGDVESGCIAGLHACADLSIVMLRLFLQMDIVKSLVIMPCCYHRIEVIGTEDRFKYFPYSELMKSKFSEFQAEKFIRVPFLRLACQQTISSFSKMSANDHKAHAKNCMFRAVLQAVCEEEDIRVTRLKRKSGKSTASSDTDEDFREYLRNLHDTHQLLSGETSVNTEYFRKKMTEKWLQYKEELYLVEALTALQTMLQALCENLVLLDRIQFLKEQGCSNCSVVKVTDDNISPRSFAIVAIK